jgi:hypothetical protein
MEKLEESSYFVRGIMNKNLNPRTGETFKFNRYKMALKSQIKRKTEKLPL